jgi:hypothetical protein
MVDGGPAPNGLRRPAIELFDQFWGQTIGLASTICCAE